MTACIVECPCPCGVRFPVDSETMRAVGSATGGNADAPQIWSSYTPPICYFHCTCDRDKVVHLGRPSPAGDSDWPEDVA